MTPIEKYFGGRILVINLKRRPDRWAHCEAQFKKHGITCAERIEAVDAPIHEGRPNGNMGCTMSHRKVLDIIVKKKWPRTLVLEDDFDILHEDFQDKFDRISREVDDACLRRAAGPDDEWDMLYLGGHYAEAPIARVSLHLIRCGRMLTTSSYGISIAMAKKMRPHISGVGPIDSLYTGFHRENWCLITQPRLIVQYSNRSDLQERDMDNSVSMMDSSHERLV